MEMTDFTESFGIANFDMSVIIEKIYFFVGIFFLLAILIGGFTIFYIMWRRDKASKQKKKIGWWEDVGNKLVPTSMEDVQEIVIPGTQLRIFYGKKRDIYLPRFNRPIDKGLYYVTLTKTGQMVNFDLPSLNKNMKEANLDFDHTDMLWAAENAREFIKKNYKDKSQKWWQVYQNTIATVALLVIFTFCFIIIIYFMRGIVQDISAVASATGRMVETACVSSQNSGIIQG